MASLIAGFLRFWKDTGTAFFLFFSVSFLIQGVNRAALGFSDDLNVRQVKRHELPHDSYLRPVHSRI